MKARLCRTMPTFDHVSGAGWTAVNPIIDGAIVVQLLRHQRRIVGLHESGNRRAGRLRVDQAEHGPANRRPVRLSSCLKVVEPAAFTECRCPTLPTRWRSRRAGGSPYRFFRRRSSRSANRARRPTRPRRRRARGCGDRRGQNRRRVAVIAVVRRRQADVSRRRDVDARDWRRLGPDPRRTGSCSAAPAGRRCSSVPAGRPAGRCPSPDR